MDIADKTRLTKLLGMLGSAFDGERANAARMISALAEKHKMTINELIAAGHTDPPMQQAYQAKPKPQKTYDPGPDWGAVGEDSKMLQALTEIARNQERYEFVLTQWECNFAEDVAARYSADYELSAKQIAIIEKIVRKAMRAHSQGT